MVNVTVSSKRASLLQRDRKKDYSLGPDSFFSLETNTLIEPL